MESEISLLKLEAHLERGDRYLDRGEYDRAEEEFKKVLATDEGNIEAHRGLGELYMVRGEMDLAVREYEMVLQMDGNSASANIALGKIYLERGAYDKAIAHLTAASKLQPYNMEIERLLKDGRRKKEMENLFARAEELFSKGNYKEALAEYEKIREMKPEVKSDPDFQYAIGVIYQKLNRLEEALDIMRRISRMEGATDDLTKRAKERINEIVPVIANGYYNRGVRYLEQGDPNRAIREFEAMLSYGGDNWRAHEGLGIAYYQVKDTEAAEREFLSALAIDPKRPRSFYYLGLIYYQRGDRERAVAQWRRAIDLAPDGPIAKAALKNIKAAGGE
ncbi:MAG: tetratricopeptide repeat protein [bacterium]